MKLTILSTSDTHGYLLPTDYTKRGMDLPFSLSKAATTIADLKAQADGPVIVIENGDWLQGSPLAYYAAKVKQDPSIVTDAYNQVGYDAGVIGNHEFNYGADYLEAASQHLAYPLLSANTMRDGKPAFGPPYQLIERDGLTIAILGLTTQYIPHWETPAHIAGLEFENVLTTAKHWVPKLHELADLVVVAYHGGFERDLETGDPTSELTGENLGYALTQIPGIDALVTGHQHRELASVVNGVPVTQPGHRGSYVGQIELTLDEKRQVVKKAAAIVPTASAKPSAMAQSLQPANAALETWLDAPLGRVEGDMRIKDAFKARLEEVPYVEFIHRVQMATTGVDISATAIFSESASGFGEAITMRDVVTNYIYPNTLAVIEVTGAVLKAALERTATYFELVDGQFVVAKSFRDPKPQHYNYDMYQGIDYTLDITKPRGQRVVALSYHGQPVSDTALYKVVTNQYRAVGGGSYSMFGADKIVAENQRDMTELIADYLRANPVVTATVDKNFTILPKM